MKKPTAGTITLLPETLDVFVVVCVQCEGHQSIGAIKGFRASHEALREHLQAFHGPPDRWPEFIS